MHSRQGRMKSQVVLAGFLAACEGHDNHDNCRKYSKHTCNELQEVAQFNVYFYYPRSNIEEYIGQVRGLSNCQSHAGAFAAEKDLLADGWDYICCLKSKENQCSERHK